MRECILVDAGPVGADAEIFIYLFIYPIHADAGRVRADALMHLHFSLGAGNANRGLI
jgi:hypothetical protein